MPYRRLQFQIGGYYHIYNRGHNYKPIFFERGNYTYFLSQLRKYLLDDTVTINAYCLMPNHYHLLVHLRQDNLSNQMQAFTVSYTKAINQRYQRTGALFQGRFQAIAVETDQYLLHLSRYIHLNPVKAKLVQKAEDWEFSSYREYLAMRNGTIPQPDTVLSYFSSPNDYRLFVEAYHNREDYLIQGLTLE